MNITSRITALSVAAATFAGIHAMDTEQARGAFTLGGDESAKPYFFSLGGDLANKAMDQGFVLVEDATARVRTTARFYGFGLTAVGQFAAGQDKAAQQRNVNPGDSTIDATEPGYIVNEVKPGEIVSLSLKADFVLEIGGVYPDNGPFLQIIPHAEVVTYPYQSQNDLKDKQRWVGGDFWWSTPFSGVELGGNSDWNLGVKGYRGAGALREFYQVAPFDLSFWQVVNWGSGTYHNYFFKSDSNGLTYSEIGAKATLPLAWVDWWVYGTANWTYWLRKKDRIIISENLNRDVGDFQFAIGIEYVPTR